MRQAIIIGTGGHSRAVISILMDAGNHEILSIMDLEKIRPEEKILDKSVNSTVSNLESFVGQFDIDIFLAIGNNLLRKNWWGKVKGLGFSLPNLISPHAFVDTHAKLGEGNIVCPNAFLGPDCRIGDDNLVNTGAILEHEVRIGNHCDFASGSIIAGRCSVDDYCSIGAGATIINGISLASGIILGAGAVLTKSIGSPNGVYIGIPAKKYRDAL